MAHLISFIPSPYRNPPGRPATGGVPASSHPRVRLPAVVIDQVTTPAQKGEQMFTYTPRAWTTTSSLTSWRTCAGRSPCSGPARRPGWTVTGP